MGNWLGVGWAKRISEDKSQHSQKQPMIHNLFDHFFLERRFKQEDKQFIPFFFLKYHLIRCYFGGVFLHWILNTNPFLDNPN